MLRSLLHIFLGVFAAVLITWAAGVFLVTLPALSAECRGQVVGASWYGPGFHGRKTASGQRFNQNAQTAAHKTLPFGTKLRVTFRGKSTVVTVNDRGPYIRGRSLDLSKAAASRIGLIGPGHGKVCMERV